jgi:hypothetical protein
VTATDLASWLHEQIAVDEQFARRVEEQVGAARAGEQFPDRSRIADDDDFPSYRWSLEQPVLEFLADGIRGRPCRASRDRAVLRPE